MKTIKNRYTKQRKSVIDNIGDKPISADEIFTVLKIKGIKIDFTSIYRSLQFFTKKGFLNEVNFGDGKKRYEKKDNNSHHHHLICENCQSIEDISLKEQVLIQEINNKSRFKIIRHSLEFFGLCQKCQ